MQTGDAPPPFERPSERRLRPYAMNTVKKIKKERFFNVHD
jgi:hypothetical protein